MAFNKTAEHVVTARDPGVSNLRSTGIKGHLDSFKQRPIDDIFKHAEKLINEEL